MALMLRGRVVVAKAMRRNKLLEFFASLPPCLVGLEASGSAHHWARELIKLGHDARMMPPAYVKPYVRRQKNDASDAAAICEAVSRPSMRFAGVRSLENQAALMRHKTREMLVSQRTQLLNGLRGHLTEVGVIAVQGPRHARELAELIEACDDTIPSKFARRWCRSRCNCGPSTKRLRSLTAPSQSLCRRMKRHAG
jgi:transposase